MFQSPHAALFDLGQGGSPDDWPFCDPLEMEAMRCRLGPLTLFQTVLLSLSDNYHAGGLHNLISSQISQGFRIWVWALHEESTYPYC
jgi:hypothetical protein